MAFGQSSNHCDAGLRYEYAPAPVVTDVTPSQGVARGDILRVTGQNFKENCHVSRRRRATVAGPTLIINVNRVRRALVLATRARTSLKHRTTVLISGGRTAIVKTRGDPIQLKLHPRLGPATGNTKLDVLSVALLGDHNLTCVMGGRTTPIVDGSCASPPSSRRSGSFINYVTGRIAEASSFYYHAPSERPPSSPLRVYGRRHARRGVVVVGRSIGHRRTRWRLRVCFGDSASTKGRGGQFHYDRLCRPLAPGVVPYV